MQLLGMFPLLAASAAVLTIVPAASAAVEVAAHDVPKTPAAQSVHNSRPDQEPYYQNHLNTPTAGSATAGIPATSVVVVSPTSTRTLRGKNRQLVQEEVVDNKQTKERKDGLFEKARDEDDKKHLSNDAFKADTENEIEAEENELRQQLPENEEEANNKNNAMEEDSSTSIFTFDADRYRDVVEKAKAKTLKGGGADKKDEKDEKERTDKENKTNDENTANEENTPKETDKKDNGKKDGTTHFGTWYEDNLETTTLDVKEPNDEEPEEASSHPATPESDEAPDDAAELEIAAEDTIKEKAVDEMMTSTTTNPPAAGEKSELKTNSEAEAKAQPKPDFESTPMDAASIIQGDTDKLTKTNQNQAGLLGMTTKDKAGIALGSISLFALVVVAAASIRRRRRRQTQFQNMKDLSSYLDLGDDPSDDGSTDYALPLYITTPTAAKYAKTDSESGESDEDNYEDDDISALPTYIAKYSIVTSPTPTGANNYDASHMPANDKAGVRELDNIVADICFEAADTKQEDTTSDSIWDHSSAPTLDTTDSVLENLPSSTNKAQETAGSSSWEVFPSCAVWS